MGALGATRRIARRQPVITLPCSRGMGYSVVIGAGHGACVVRVMARLDDRPDDWRSDAACSWGHDPNLWFPRDQTEAELALAVCKRCPVLRKCGEVSRRESWGIWAGQFKERRQAWKNRAEDD